MKISVLTSSFFHMGIIYISVSTGKPTLSLVLLLFRISFLRALSFCFSARLNGDWIEEPGFSSPYDTFFSFFFISWALYF